MIREVKTIMHLDDHRIFVKGIQKLLSARLDFDYFSFESPIVALKDIEERLQKKLPIDLIITDYNHQGITGYQFACELRKLERVYLKKTPIILLTMVPDDHPDVRKGREEKVFDAYFQKTVEADEFLKSIEKLFDRYKRDLSQK